jgi:hypothetical protein
MADLSARQRERPARALGRRNPTQRQNCAARSLTRARCATSGTNAQSCAVLILAGTLTFMPGVHHLSCLYMKRIGTCSHQDE